MKYNQCQVYNGATIIPGILGYYDKSRACAYDENFNYIPESVQTQMNPSFLHPYQVPKLTYDIDAIYGGAYINHIGHFMLESLARLWYAKERPEMPIIWNSASLKIPKYQREIFDIYGIKNEFIFVSGPTLVKRLHIPNPLVRLAPFYSDDYFNSLGVYEGKDKVPGKKIFISRASIKGRGYSNEQEIEQYAIDNGYKILIPEHISMKERLDEYSSAEEILMIQASSMYPLMLIKNFSTTLHILQRVIDPPLRALSEFYGCIHTLNCKEKVVYEGVGTSSNILYASIENIDLSIKNQDYLAIESLPEAIDIGVSLQEQKILQPFVSKCLDSLIAAMTAENESILCSCFNEALDKYCTFTDVILYRDSFDEHFNFYCLLLFPKVKDTSKIIKSFIDFMMNFQLGRVDVQSRFIKLLDCIPNQHYMLYKINIVERILIHIIENKVQTTDWFINTCYTKLVEFYTLTNQNTKANSKYAMLIQRLGDEIISYEELISYLVTHVFIKSHKFSLAIEGIQKGFTMDANWAKGYVLLSMVYEGMGLYDKSIECARQAIAISPHDINLQERLLHFLRRKQAFNVADAFVDQMALSNPTWKNAYLQRSNNQNARGDFVRAAYYAQKAVQYNPENLNLTWNSVTYLRLQYNFEAARQVIETFLQKNPYSPEADIQLARIHQSQGKLDDALDLAKKVVQLAPNNLGYATYLFNLYRMKGDFDSLLEHAQEYIKKMPSWSEPYIQTAYAFDAKGSTDIAIEYAQEAIEIDPYNFSPKTVLFNLLRRKKNFDAVRVLLNKYMEQFPYWGEPYIQLSYIYEAMSEPNSAIEYAIKATEVEPYNLRTRVYLFNILWKNNKFDVAVDHITKCIEKFPHWAEPYIQMVAIYDAKNLKQDALASLYKAIEVEPANFVLRKKLCDRLHQEGFIEELQKELIAAAQYNPFWAFPNYNVDTVTPKALLEQEITLLHEKLLTAENSLVSLNKQMKEKKHGIKLVYDFVLPQTRGYVQSVLLNIIEPFIKKNIFSLFKRAEYGRCEKIAKDIIQKAPHLAWPYYILGKTQWEQGNAEESLENLEKAIVREPYTIYFTVYTVSNLIKARQLDRAKEIIQFVSEYKKHDKLNILLSRIEKLESN